ncbi:hypothetical protein ACNKHS_04855 [Shigella flexneri]
MKTIEWMAPRHEEVAAFAAGAEAQLTGNSRSVRDPITQETCISSTACSMPAQPRAGAGDCGSHSVIRNGYGYFQETHPQELFRECSHSCELVSTPEQIPGVLAIAMRKAVLNRGVSVVVRLGTWR